MKHSGTKLESVPSPPCGDTGTLQQEICWMKPAPSRMAGPSAGHEQDVGPLEQIGRNPADDRRIGPVELTWPGVSKGVVEGREARLVGGYDAYLSK